jgi:foldase protein PrsA
LLRVFSLVALCLLAAPVAFAGEPPLPADTIARVQERPILKADFEHWMDVANVSAGHGKMPAPGSDDYAQLRDQVLQLLISFEWLRGEARDRGIWFSKAAVRAELRREKRQSFESERDYQRFLEETHQTEADILQRVRLDLISLRLRERVVAGAKTDRGKDRRLDRWLKRFTRKWRKRTVCGESYATSDCGRTAPISP